MNKTGRTFFTLLLAVLLLSACTRKQGPTRVGNLTGNGDSMSNAGFDPGFIPENPDDWSTAGLTPRGSNDVIGNGKYKGFTMVEGELPSVYFGFDSSSIAPSERAKLQQAANYLEQNPGHHILIEGHCDWYGTSEYNLALGDRRANSASDYLGTLGISPLRIETLSKGSLEATSDLSKAQSAEDRRADLILLQK